MSARDLHAALGRAIESLEVENVGLQREVERLSRENGEQCDDVESLRVAARKGGLDEAVRQSLTMIQRYVDEGDTLDSVRVLTCLRRALDAVAQSKEAA